MGIQRRLTIATFVCLSLCGSALAESAMPAVTPKRSPQEYFMTAMRDIKQYAGGDKVTGESYCWHAKFYLGNFVKGYRAFNDRAWLDFGVMYYDHLVSMMATGPDGFKGWIGPFIYDKKVWCDVHVSDAAMAEGLLEFAELVLKTPALADRYGDKARGYVALVARNIFDKWDARGTWREDGRFGGYVSWDKYGRPWQFTGWTERDDVRKSGLSLPFNKQNHMGVMCLRLWRITGETKYRERAEKIFSFMRSRFQFFDDHYVWNYWEPLGPWDIRADRRDAVHWMGVHPYRNYQAGEIGQIVEAYHSGVVFSKTDIQRIINTNLKVMWNGDRAKPAFRNSNATIPGYREAKPSKQYPGKAGTLWTALADFDSTVRELQGRRYPKAGSGPMSIEEAYFRFVTLARPVSFKRKYVVEPQTLPSFPSSESPELIVAASLPSVIQRGQETLLICDSLVNGSEVKIELFDADGENSIAQIHAGPMRDPMIVAWTALDPKNRRIYQGDYRIRWTFKTGYREFPVHIP